MSTEDLLSEYPTDNDKQYVQTGKDEKVTGFVNPEFAYSITGRFIIYRLMKDRDVKITITSKGKTTGTGKTMLALDLARWTNRVRNQLFDKNHVWSAKEYAFMDVYEYLQKYSTADPGDPLITDELEYLADRRRSMSNQNVNFSKAWSMLRYRNVVTIGTAPGLSDLDKRIPEATDLWINVIHPGRANVYYMTVDDFKWVPIIKRLKMFGYRETIRWKDKPENKDYIFLKEMKANKGVPGIDENAKIDESDLKDAKRNEKVQITANILKYVQEKGLDSLMPQGDIGDVVGMSQQWVSKVNQEYVED